MSAATYLIAKYIPDLFRNEPRNIGVILWSEAGVFAKFRGVDSSGGMDGRTFPDFIGSTDVYKQWVKTWLRCISVGKMQYIGKRETEEASSPKFLDALTTTSNGNYVLIRGGEIFEKVDSDNVSNVLEFLYKSLVWDEPEKEAEKHTLETECSRVMELSKLDGDPMLRENETVACAFGAVTKRFEFSYYYGNGTPSWLAQKIHFSSKAKEMEKTVESFAWKFDRVIQSSVVARDRNISFIYPSREQEKSPGVVEAIAELSSVSKVVNLHDKCTAVSVLLALVSGAKHHV